MSVILLVVDFNIYLLVRRIKLPFVVLHHSKGEYLKFIYPGLFVARG